MKIRLFTFLYIFCLTPYTAASDGTIKTMSKNLEKYYADMGCIYCEHIGKLEEYCNKNEFDNEDVLDDLKGDQEDSLLVDFDLNFPLQADSTDNADRGLQIFKLLRKFAGLDPDTGNPQVAKKKKDAAAPEEYVEKKIGIGPLVDKTINDCLSKGSCPQLDILLAIYMYLKNKWWKLDSAEDEMKAFMLSQKSDVSFFKIRHTIIEYINRCCKGATAGNSNNTFDSDTNIFLSHIYSYLSQSDVGEMKGIGIGSYNRTVRVLFSNRIVKQFDIKKGFICTHKLRKMGKKEIKTCLFVKDKLIVTYYRGVTIANFRKNRMQEVWSLDGLELSEVFTYKNNHQSICNRRFIIDNIALRPQTNTMFLLNEAYKVFNVDITKKTVNPLKIYRSRGGKLSNMRYVQCCENDLLLFNDIGVNQNTCVTYNIKSKTTQLIPHSELLSIIPPQTKDDPSIAVVAKCTEENEYCRSERTKKVDLIRLNDNKPILSLSLKKPVKFAHPFSNNNKLLTVAGEVISIWDILKNGSLEDSLVDTSEIMTLSVSGDYALTVNKAGAVKHWCLSKGTSNVIYNAADKKHGIAHHKIRLFNNGHAAVIVDNGKVVIYNNRYVKTGLCFTSPKKKSSPNRLSPSQKSSSSVLEGIWMRFFSDIKSEFLTENQSKMGEFVKLLVKKGVARKKADKLRPLLVTYGFHTVHKKFLTKIADIASEEILKNEKKDEKTVGVSIREKIDQYRYTNQPSNILWLVVTELCVTLGGQIDERLDVLPYSRPYIGIAAKFLALEEACKKMGLHEVLPVTIADIILLRFGSPSIWSLQAREGKIAATTQCARKIMRGK